MNSTLNLLTDLELQFELIYKHETTKFEHKIYIFISISLY